MIKVRCDEDQNMKRDFCRYFTAEIYDRLLACDLAQRGESGEKKPRLTYFDIKRRVENSQRLPGVILF